MWTMPTLCAAVADYAPETVASSKIKRKQSDMTLNLVPNPDIAAELGKIKKKGMITVGFALETDNELENARQKLKRKNLDAIVLNSLKDEGAGFAHDTNRVTIISSCGDVVEGVLKRKEEVASDIVDYVEKLLLCSRD